MVRETKEMVGHRHPFDENAGRAAKIGKKKLALGLNREMLLGWRPGRGSPRASSPSIAFSIGN
jgi:hypothetical protein